MQNQIKSEDDSFINYKYKDWIRDFTSLGNPIILLFVPFAVLGPQPVYFKLLLALLINEIFCSLIKFFFHKPRPDGQSYKGALEKIDAGSFPSIHASRIALVYFTLFNSTEELSLKIAFISVIFIVALSRVLLKRHFWTDIIGGLFIGISIYFIFNHFSIL